MTDSKDRDDAPRGGASPGGDRSALDSGGGPLPAPFGWGVESRGPAEAPRSVEEGDGSADGGGASRSRSTRFRCALDRPWERCTATEFDRALDEAAAAEPGQERGPRWARASSLPPFDESALGGALEPFREEGRLAEGQAHLCVRPAALMEALAHLPGGPMGDSAGGGGTGPRRDSQRAPSTRTSIAPIALGPLVVRLSVHEPANDQARRLLMPLLQGRSVVVLSSPELPIVAVAIVDWILETWPLAPIALLHHDGLDCERTAASRTNIAGQIVAPEAHFDPQLVALERSRMLMVEERDAELQEAAGAIGTDKVGHFGSGVVGPPLPDFEICTVGSTSDIVDGDLDPEEAAEQVVESAFGSAVLGGFSTSATSRIFVARSIFSPFTEYLLELLDQIEDDPRHDPPFWHFSRRTRRNDALGTARRLGLDEGATLIF
ncbi:MAG: hypothetical protein AAGG01_22220, partial [Planctomycetota bacterium]